MVSILFIEMGFRIFAALAHHRAENTHEAAEHNRTLTSMVQIHNLTEIVALASRVNVTQLEEIAAKANVSVVEIVASQTNITTKLTLAELEALAAQFNVTTTHHPRAMQPFPPKQTNYNVTHAEPKYPKHNQTSLPKPTPTHPTQDTNPKNKNNNQTDKPSELNPTHPKHNLTDAGPAKYNLTDLKDVIAEFDETTEPYKPKTDRIYTDFNTTRLPSCNYAIPNTGNDCIHGLNFTALTRSNDFWKFMDSKGWAISVTLRTSQPALSRDAVLDAMTATNGLQFKVGEELEEDLRVFSGVMTDGQGNLRMPPKTKELKTTQKLPAVKVQMVPAEELRGCRKEVHGKLCKGAVSQIPLANFEKEREANRMQCKALGYGGGRCPRSTEA